MYPIASFVCDGTTGGYNFTNIPQTYKNLQLRITHRSTSSNTGAFMFLFINGFYGSPFTQYTLHQMYATQSVAPTATNAINIARIEFGYPNAAFSTDTSMIDASIIDIADYSSSNKIKTVKGLFGSAKASTANVMQFTGMYKDTTNQITELGVSDAYGNFAAGCKIDLYGLVPNNIATGV